MKNFSRTQLNFVIGFPLIHSQSPFLHNALYKKVGINAFMLPVSNKRLVPLISAIRVLGIRLTAVTMPFKQTIIPYLDKVDPKAMAIKAVNTVINKNGKLFGFNTDIDGIIFALQNQKISDKTVLIIGAGGAARAAAYYVKNKKGKILYLNRTKNKALLLQKAFGGKVVGLKDLYQKNIDILINATPIGAYPKTKALPVPKEVVKKCECVFDIVYNPLQTSLIKLAHNERIKTISGIEMFIGQALKQIELFSGKKIAKSQTENFSRNLLVKHIGNI